MLIFLFPVFREMSESMQHLLHQIECLIFEIEVLYEDIIDMDLPLHVRKYFLEWHGIVVDFLREQRELLEANGHGYF